MNNQRQVSNNVKKGRGGNRATGGAGRTTKTTTTTSKNKNCQQVSPYSSAAQQAPVFMTGYCAVEPAQTYDHYKYEYPLEPTVVSGWEYWQHAQQIGDRYEHIGKDEDTGEPLFLDYDPKSARRY